MSAAEARRYLFGSAAVGAARSLDVQAANKLPDLLNIHLRQERQLIKSLLKFSRRRCIFHAALPPTSDRLRNKRSFVRCDTDFLLPFAAARDSTSGLYKDETKTEYFVLLFCRSFLAVFSAVYQLHLVLFFADTFCAKQNDKVWSINRNILCAKWQ